MTTPSQDQFQTLALNSITPSLTNPRKAFNADRLAELAESIKASGVHQPILVRPLPGNRVGETGRKVTHEIVAGERRYRASQLAGATTIPALVRDLSDDQVLEIQIVENLQRDDLTQLEEAEGYHQLMHHSALTSDQVAAKIGKSRSYVYARLKLLDLSMECKDAMRAGTIDNSRALLIALATERRDLTLYNPLVHQPWPVIDSLGNEHAPSAQHQLDTPLREEAPWHVWASIFKARAEGLMADVAREAVATKKVSA